MPTPLSRRNSCAGRVRTIPLQASKASRHQSPSPPDSIPTSDFDQQSAMIHIVATSTIVEKKIRTCTTDLERRRLSDDVTGPTIAKLCAASQLDLVALLIVHLPSQHQGLTPSMKDSTAAGDPAPIEWQQAAYDTLSSHGLHPSLC